VHHFVSAGFAWDDPHALDVLEAADPTGVFAEAIIRVPFGNSAANAMAALTAHETTGRTVVMDFELPRAGENEVFDDDDAVADWVEQVARQAAVRSAVPVFLDGFMDHDRGYYRYHGLIDRAFNPRPALGRLISVAARGRHEG
jgi:hypothetical protein